jgi:hypothetical protein
MDSREKKLTKWEMASALGWNVRTLHKRRLAGFCIPYEVIKGKVWYDRSVVADYLSKADPVGRFVAEELRRVA